MPKSPVTSACHQTIENSMDGNSENTYNITHPTTAFIMKPMIFFTPDFNSFSTINTAAMTPIATSMLVHKSLPRCKNMS